MHIKIPISSAILSYQRQLVLCFFDSIFFSLPLNCSSSFILSSLYLDLSSSFSWFFWCKSWAYFVFVLRLVWIAIRARCASVINSWNRYRGLESRFAASDIYEPCPRICISWQPRLNSGEILRADDNSCFFFVLSLFLTAGRDTSGTSAILFSFTRILKGIGSTIIIVVNYYKVNKWCLLDATTLTPGNPHLKLKH